MQRDGPIGGVSSSSCDEIRMMQILLGESRFLEQSNLDDRTPPSNTKHAYTVEQVSVLGRYGVVW